MSPVWQMRIRNYIIVVEGVCNLGVWIVTSSSRFIRIQRLLTSNDRNIPTGIGIHPRAYIVSHIQLDIPRFPITIALNLTLSCLKDAEAADLRYHPPMQLRLYLLKMPKESRAPGQMRS